MVGGALLKTSGFTSLFFWDWSGEKKKCVNPYSVSTEELKAKAMKEHFVHETSKEERLLKLKEKKHQRDRVLEISTILAKPRSQSHSCK